MYHPGMSSLDMSMTSNVPDICVTIVGTNAEVLLLQAKDYNNFLTMPLKVIVCQKSGYTADAVRLNYSFEVQGQDSLRDLLTRRNFESDSQRLELVLDTQESLRRPHDHYLYFDSERHRKERLRGA
eukprot:CAMPEP_0197687310 /NCGR_PEP_ID=MMETSP1338-20131121/103788_1 /TAXON_ID=43686 ORGANISM="Pelagodinium beii, Strain RCC1491" /NCGR_SAMPLE_ID=MMETSP1338 /ASSEMBLY_ACC=CAM_ASM_000754 /LENGTH=125 /DNA_ID=CAMNT_0043269389 /DNA_START=276 /DNA_END=653 /DNA_ORIENTATION=-